MSHSASQALAATIGGAVNRDNWIHCANCGQDGPPSTRSPGWCKACGIRAALSRWHEAQTAPAAPALAPSAAPRTACVRWQKKASPTVEPLAGPPAASTAPAVDVLPAPSPPPRPRRGRPPRKPQPQSQPAQDWDERRQILVAAITAETDPAARYLLRIQLLRVSHEPWKTPTKRGRS